MPDGSPIPDNTFRVDPNTPTNWTHYDPYNILNGGSNSMGIINPTNSDFFPSGAPEGTLKYKDTLNQTNLQTNIKIGNQAALLWLSLTATTYEAGIEQTLNDIVTANTRYTLTVEVGNIASGTGSSSSASGSNPYNLNGFPGYRIDLMAGNQILVSDDNTLLPAEGAWETSIISVDVLSGNLLIGETLGIRLINLHIHGTTEAPAIEVDYDNVRLDAISISGNTAPPTTSQPTTNNPTTFNPTTVIPTTGNPTSVPITSVPTTSQ
eukprot:436175_1